MANPIILNGRSLAQIIEADLSQRIKNIMAYNGNRSPILATILVGDDPASATYVKMKEAACLRIGLTPRKIDMPGTITTADLLAHIEKLNTNPHVCGILLQHPVPTQVNERAAFDAIDIQKDVDGVTCLGFGRMTMGKAAYGSATPAGIMKLLDHYEINCEGKHAVVVGRSPILGKPAAQMLLNKNATVTICHSRTQNLPDLIRQADIIVGAVGIPRFIRGEWIQDGAVIVDAGYHPQEKCGDIDLENCKDRSSAYTPVPGGVGPMTIATLMMQTVEAAEIRYIPQEGNHE